MLGNESVQTLEDALLVLFLIFGIPLFVWGLRSEKIIPVGIGLTFLSCASSLIGWILR